jgi:hypothetical protein
MPRRQRRPTAPTPLAAGRAEPGRGARAGREGSREQGIEGSRGAGCKSAKNSIKRRFCGVWLAPGAGCRVAKVRALESGKVPITRCAREVNRRQVSRRKEGAGALAGEMMSCRLMRGLSARGRAVSARHSIKPSAFSSQLSARKRGLRVYAREWRGNAAWGDKVMT